MEGIASTQPLDCGAHAAKHARAPVQNANISFSLSGATGVTYKRFITDLRNVLTVNSHKVFDIPVLPATARGQARFILVNLTNFQRELVTIAIDTIDVYIVAYRANNKAFFLKDVSQEAKDNLFRDIKPEPDLHFKGNYDDLERYAGNISRENIYLGFSELGSSIGNLFHHKPGNSVPRAFIVIIQSLAEAARFKYIEQRISENVNSKFRPDPAFLSLQNRWSNLSEQIQKAQNNGGRFPHPVQVRSVSNKPIMVEDVNSPVVKGIALLLNNSRGNAALMQPMMMEELNCQWEDARGEFGVDF